MNRITTPIPITGQEHDEEHSLKTVLFHLPVSMLHHCFAPRDLQRLEKRYHCIYPAADDPDTMADAWSDHAAELHAVVTGWDSLPITESMLAIAPQLEVVVHSAGSIRPFIPEAIWRSGIRIATANDALGKGVAETALGLIIAGLKGFFPCAQLTRSGEWQAALPCQGYGRVRELYDVRIGLVGASRTGRHLLRLLTEFDAEVVLSDPTLTAEDADALGVRLVSLEELMRVSDVVSLHAPALPELRHMLGAPEFQSMKDDAIFINTARGMLVNEEALAAELMTGRISAILDVTSPEPPAADSPFRSLPNVILLPHIAGAISTGCLRQGRSTVDQLLEFLRGETVHGEVTRERFATMA